MPIQNAHILLVDDDPELAGLLADYLRGEGFRCDWRENGQAAITALQSAHYDLVVMDVMMPVMSGIEALARLRQFSQTPVIMLTAKGDDQDRILGLELGADDYVAKPCTPRELAARVKAVLRRSQHALDSAPPSQPTKAILQAGAVTLCPQTRKAELDGQALNLTSTEFNLLEVLIRHHGEVVSREKLSEQALGKPLARFDRSIDVHLSSIRRKLGNLPDGRSYIQTIVRVGYQFIS